MYRKTATVIVLATAGLTWAVAQERTFQPDDRARRTSESKPSRNEISADAKTIAFDVVIADVNSDADVVRKANGSGAKALQLIEESEKQNKSKTVSRVHLSTLENVEGLVQSGEMRTVRSGSTADPRGGGRTVSSSVSMGTLVQATGRIADDGAILAEMTIEKSWVDDQSADDADGERPRMPTVTTKATLRIPDGGSVILGGVHSTGAAGNSEIVVVVTAKTEAGETAKAKFKAPQTARDAIDDPARPSP